jgi:hypothetical protein
MPIRPSLIRAEIRINPSFAVVTATQDGLITTNQTMTRTITMIKN